MKTHKSYVTYKGIFKMLFSLFVWLILNWRIIDLGDIIHHQEPLKPLQQKVVINWDPSDLNNCGSAGCALQVEDELGRILLNDISQAKPNILTTTTDGFPDLSIEHKHYPANGSVDTEVVCYNSINRSYSSAHCSLN